jgi:hypothetical protein
MTGGRRRFPHRGRSARAVIAPAGRERGHRCDGRSGAFVSAGGRGIGDLHSPVLRARFLMRYLQVVFVVATRSEESDVDMASVTHVQLVDDLDGGAADESVTFGLDGRLFEIDLSDKHASELRNLLAPYVDAARRASGSGSARRRAPVRPGSSDRELNTAIREWAIQNGHLVSARGRIPSAVLQAFENRGGAPAAAAPAEPPAEKPAAPAVTFAPAVSESEAPKPKRRTRKKATAETDA